MNNPKISVIIPVYNGEKYLSQCLDSLINQTFKDIEIICIDDGSTDNSIEILEQYAQKDSRIKIINQENSGAAEARNNGLAHAAGDYLSILDCDDFFDSDMFELMYDRAVKYDAEITFCKGRTFDDKTKVIKEIDNIKFEILPDKDVFSAKDAADRIFQIDINWCWDKLYKASYVKQNNFLFQTTKVHNDSFFAVYPLTKCKRISVLDKTLCTYRINIDTSVTSTSKRMKYPLSFYEVLIFLKDSLIKDNAFELFKQSFANYALDIFCGYYRFVNIKFKEDFLKNLNIKKLDVKKTKSKYFLNKKHYLLYIILLHKPLIMLSTIFFPFWLIIKKIRIFLTK
ncbi:MAG: glycosyltransferase [Endomicrobiaceae bacterium]|nr:glycosyltransferase [Endomicrobiaceae bacterium]